jgi:hypothetical protein
VNEYLLEVRAYFADVLTSLGSDDPEGLAAQVHALVAGAITLGAALRTSGPARSAGEAARELVSVGKRREAAGYPSGR